MPAIRGVLFDKDGTLFDFNATWAAWACRFLGDLADGDERRAAALGRVIGFDLDSRSFYPDSPVIAGTPREIAEVLAPHLPDDPDALVWRINAEAASAPLVPAVTLPPLLEQLRARGLALGVATNDAEAPARAHLRHAGIEDAFDFVAGFDSGHGGKPAPGMLLAFAHRTGLRPAEILMVGDSRHDLLAARAAGTRAAAVLTGPALADELAPLAEVVLPDIGHLPGWIAAQAEDLAAQA